MTPRAVLTWKPSSEQTFYASYSRGLRSGFTQQPNVQAVFPDFIILVEPDHLTNYELGSKGSVLDGRLPYEAAVFYIYWKDVQRSLTARLPIGRQTQAQIYGTGASSIGASLAVTARVSEVLEPGANIRWNDLTFDADVISGSTTLFRKGARLSCVQSESSTRKIGFAF